VHSFVPGRVTVSFESIFLARREYVYTSPCILKTFFLQLWLRSKGERHAHSSRQDSSFRSGCLLLHIVTLSFMLLLLFDRWC
jgi:hypothetical protein